MSSEEDNLRRLVVELRILEGTAEALQSRVNLVNAALAELRVAGITVERLEKESKEAPLFVPIGGGSYVKARLESADTVLIGVGAGIAIEKTMNDAKEKVENRIVELEKTRTSLQQQLSQVLVRIRDGRSKLEALSANLGEEEKRRSVRKTKARD